MVSKYKKMIQKEMINAYKEIDAELHLLKIQHKNKENIFDEEYQKYEKINSIQTTNREEFYNVQDQINEIEYNLKSMEDEIENIWGKMEECKSDLYDIYVDVVYGGRT